MAQKGIKITHKMCADIPNLTQIRIPNYVKKISCNAFENCTSLREVVFESPSSLLFISSSAFKNCRSLRKISIPPTVITIGKWAFKDCISLEEIILPSKAILMDAVFDKCPDGLNRTIIESSENEYEKPLHKLVSILFSDKYINDLRSYDFTKENQNDEILDQIVDMFKKFPNLYDDDNGELIMSECAKLNIENDVKQYFCTFLPLEIKIHIYKPDVMAHELILHEFTVNENESVKITADLVKAKYDGVNQFFYYDSTRHKILSNDKTFKENQVKNDSIIVVLKTMVGLNE